MSDHRPDGHIVTTLGELERLYEAPGWIATAKELDHVSEQYRAFIEAAPFCVLATSGPTGVSCSPRGDMPGFVRVRDSRTLLIPDRSGNNRIDSLRNLVSDPRMSLLFLIPGCSETLRVAGRTVISIDPALLATFALNGKTPRSVLVVSVERVFYQCASAVNRAKLWDPARFIDRKALPSTNAILASIQWRNVRQTFGLAAGKSRASRPAAEVAMAESALASIDAIGASAIDPDRR